MGAYTGYKTLAGLNALRMGLNDMQGKLGAPISESLNTGAFCPKISCFLAKNVWLWLWWSKIQERITRSKGLHGYTLKKSFLC